MKTSKAPTISHSVLVHNTHMFEQVKAVKQAYSSIQNGLSYSLPHVSTEALKEGERLWLNSRRDLRNKITDMIAELNAEQTSFASLDNWVFEMKKGQHHWRRKVDVPLLNRLIFVWNGFSFQPNNPEYIAPIE